MMYKYANIYFSEIRLIAGVIPLLGADAAGIY
jgi:hypothetical protein